MRVWVTFGPGLRWPLQVLKGVMGSPWVVRGVAMMVIGLLIVLATVLIIFVTADPLPTSLMVIGIVFIAVGSRQRRRG